MILRVMWYYAESMRTYRLRRGDLDSLQMKRFSRTIRLAYQTVPYYHDLLRRLGKVPEDFATLRDIRAIPLLQKQDAIDNYFRLISRRGSAKYSRGGSGTSGVDLRITFSQEYRDQSVALQGRRLAEFGMKPWHRLVSIWSPQSYWRRDLVGKTKGRPSTISYEMGPIVSLGRFASVVRFLQAAQDDPAHDMAELKKLRPDFIMARASHLRRMASYADGYGAGTRIKGVNCVVEAFTDTCARDIERAFGGKVLHSYGSNELGAAGAECRFQRGTHLNEDWNLFEVLRDGEPVGPGERGELVATTFNNDVMPLVRYATGDTVELADGGMCDCGSSMVRLRAILGRRSDWLRTVDGSPLSPFDVAEFIEETFRMRDYQLVQTRIGQFEVKSLDPVSDETRLAAPLGAYLSEKIGSPISLTFTKRPKKDIWLKNRPVVCAMR